MFFDYFMKHFYTSTGVFLDQIQNSSIFLFSEHFFNILNMNFNPVQPLIGNILQRNAIFKLSQSRIAFIFRDNHLWIFIVHQEKRQSFFHIIHSESFPCLSKHFFAQKSNINQFNSATANNLHPNSLQNSLEGQDITILQVLSLNFEKILKNRKTMYKKGDYVFAKTEGHLPFPARITKIDKAKGHYHVSFVNYRSTSVVERSALQQFHQSTIQRYQKQYEGTDQTQKRGVLRSIKVAESLLNKIQKGSKKKLSKDSFLVQPSIKIEIEAKYEQNMEKSQLNVSESQKVKIQKDNNCKQGNNIPQTVHARTRNQIKIKQSASTNKKPKLEYIETISSKQSSKNSDIFNYQSSNIRSVDLSLNELKVQKDSQKQSSLMAIEQLNQFLQSYDKNQNLSYDPSIFDGLNYIQQDEQDQCLEQISSYPKQTSNSQYNLHDFRELSSLDDYFSDDESTLENIELNRQIDFDPHKKKSLYFTRNLEQGDQQGLMQIIDQQVAVPFSNEIERKMQTLSKYLKIQLNRIKRIDKYTEKTQNPLDMNKRQIFTSIIYDHSLSFQHFAQYKCIFLLFEFVFKYQQSQNQLKECMMGEYFIARSMLNIFFMSDKWKQQIFYLGYEQILKIQKQVYRYRNRLICTRPI